MKNIHLNTNHHFSKKILSCIAVFMVLATMLIPIFSTNASAASSDQINYFGTVVPCGKDNGYKPNTKSSWNPWTLLTVPGTIMGLIPDDDPHKGWSLGSFFVKGYSGMTESSLNSYQKNMPVYLKNAGDVVSFGFKLDQNINKLNGNSNYKISYDKKVVQDCWVEDPYVSGDLGRGVLIIVHRDWQGNEKKIVYKDFLNGKNLGANTEVQLFEEGDYRVVLCYEIYKDTKANWITDWLDPNGSWFNYRIESYFSVRNGNAMVFPFDLGTGAELTNKSCTETGFRVDLAKSRYLKLSVKKENLNSTGTDIVEDTRFNKVIADGTEFKAEGKYTITVKNVYTDLTTEKIIYVGSNDVMRCNTVTGLSVSTINERVRNGYTINKDGTLRAPTRGDIADSSSSVTSNESKDGPNVNIWMIFAIMEVAIIIVVVAVVVITREYD